ncbi:unnamed protein product, partial [marine sediment metagenome]
GRDLDSALESAWNETASAVECANHFKMEYVHVLGCWKEKWLMECSRGKEGQAVLHHLIYDNRTSLEYYRKTHEETEETRKALGTSLIGVSDRVNVDWEKYGPGEVAGAALAGGGLIVEDTEWGPPSAEDKSRLLHRNAPPPPKTKASPKKPSRLKSFIGRMTGAWKKGEKERDSQEELAEKREKEKDAAEASGLEKFVTALPVAIGSAIFAKAAIGVMGYIIGGGVGLAVAGPAGVGPAATSAGPMAAWIGATLAFGIG